VIPIEPLVASSARWRGSGWADTRVKLAFRPFERDGEALPTASPSMVTRVPVGAAAGVKPAHLRRVDHSNVVALVAVPARSSR